MLKKFTFIVETESERGAKRRYSYKVSSMHLQGAVRKLYQTYKFDNLVRIIE